MKPIYRGAYSLSACNGILNKFEFPLRAERFVTRNIVAKACRIAERAELLNTECGLQYRYR